MDQHRPEATQPLTPPTSPPQFVPEPPSSTKGKGLAVTALILGVIGFLLSPLALVGLILGIIALARSNRGDEARGFAIGAVCASVVAFVFGCVLSIGILLPALGKARQTARQLKSANQLHDIGRALSQYSSANSGWFPESASDWQQRLIATGAVTAEVLVAPAAQPGEASYFYIPGFNTTSVDPESVVVIENPSINRDRGANFLRANGAVESVFGPDFWTTVGKLRGPDGKPVPIAPSVGGRK